MLTSKNRGLDFEELINKSNKYYAERNIAYIYKKPTNIKIIKSQNGRILDGVFLEKSTTDYNGIYNGYYIDFEAKSTIGDKFRVKHNLHTHQLTHLENISKHQGIGFVLVYFKTLNSIFLITIKQILEFEKNIIPYAYFQTNCYELKEGLNPSIDYLKIIDYLIKELDEK